jgi:hypothetical protein
VFEKWKPQLRPSQIIAGLWVLAPKIISDKFADDKKKEPLPQELLSVYLRF